jgi:putative acetyltransferase
MKTEIQPIRQAARQLVRELHLLDGRFCIEGFTFSECHLITELESMGQATASELGERLVLEKSTMSRLVNGLLAQGHIKSARDPVDGRRRLLRLTRKGKNGAVRINRYSNRQVGSALDFVTSSDRETVVTGLDRYAKALRYARISAGYDIRPIRRKDNPAVARIIRQVMTEYSAVGCGYSILDPEVDAMYESYPAPEAAFFVIESDGKVLGCGGMGPLVDGDPGVCELRKMYLLPELRGSGQGTRLLAIILDAARQAGHRQCYLETLEHMTHARQLYLKHGFEFIDAPMGNTGHSGCNSWMLMTL